MPAYSLLLTNLNIIGRSKISVISLSHAYLLYSYHIIDLSEGAHYNLINTGGTIALSADKQSIFVSDDKVQD